MMIYILIIIAVANAQYLPPCTIYCKKKIAGSLLDNICKCYKSHIIRVRDVEFDDHWKHASSDAQSDLPFDDKHLNNRNTEMKSHEEPDSLLKHSQGNLSPDLIYVDTNHSDKKSLRAKPVIDYIPKDELNQSENTINHKIELASPDDSYGDISITDIVSELPKCIELLRLQSSRMCPTKENDEKGQDLHSFEKLTDDELVIEIEKNCKKINAIIENSLIEIKGKYNKNAFEIKNISEVFPKSTTDNSATTIIVDDVTTSPSPDSYDLPTEFNNQSHIDSLFDKTGDEAANADYLAQTEESSTTRKITPEEIISTEMTHPTNLDIFNSSITSSYTTTTSITDNEEKKPTDNSLKDISNEIANQHNSDFLMHKHLSTTPIEEDTTSTYNELSNDYIQNLVHEPEIFAERDNSATEPSTNISKILNTKDEDDHTRYVYNQNQVPVVKIISREFLNGTVLSEINGTETIMNNDFPLDHNYTNLFVKNINVDDNNNVSEILYRFSIPKYTSHIEESQESGSNVAPISTGLIGRLYFINDSQKIPVQFVQEADGKLNVGLDILALCDNENEENPSQLIKALCNCIKPPKCSSEDNN